LSRDVVIDLDYTHGTVLSSHLHARLQLEEVALVVVGEFVVSASLHDFPVVQDKEGLAIANGAESVGDHD